MKAETIHNKGQAKLFSNKHLEYFTKSHPLVIWCMYITIIAAMLYQSNSIADIGTGKTIISISAGLFFWTFFEYIIHRFAFHLTPKSKLAIKVVYIIHGNHHHYPRDKERLFMPPLPSIILATAIFLIMYLFSNVFGVTEFTVTFFAGFIFGYLMYGTMHYAIHAWRPPFKWMKPLWRNHHLHHYKEEQKGFGVSTTFWDRLFGTMYDLKKEKEDKEKVSELIF
jgi:sterol desaturase/sphingolipid hydroxylase (fatty acid hydroxylase superfamily)